MDDLQWPVQSKQRSRTVCHRDSPLSTNNAHDLLVGDEEPIARLPYRPMGGRVFKYLKDDGPQDWSTNGNRWVNQGTKYLPRRNPLVENNYFYIQTETGGASKDFLRNIFFLPSDKETGPFLVQYLGDLSASTVFAHKNSKPDKATVFV